MGTFLWFTRYIYLNSSTHFLIGILPVGLRMAQAFTYLNKEKTSFTKSDLLVRSNEKIVHVQNLQRLMVEIYKTLNHENPLFLSELFKRREIRYNLRIKDIVLLPTTSTVAFGMKSICFRGSILLKSCEAVASFCRKIRTWAGVLEAI